MNDSPSPSDLMPNVRIGIAGLPGLTNNMVQGGLYALIAETSSARFPLFASSLGCALKDGRNCTVILPANPEHFLQRLESLGDLKVQGLLETGRFNIYVMQEEFSKKMFRFGAERFVAELEQLEIPPNSYLVFDQADDLISLHDVSIAIEQVSILSKWFAAQRITALLVFLRSTEAQAGTINALMDYLTGIARLGGDENGLRLAFDYWQSPDGTVAARTFHLLTLENNCYEATVKPNSVEAPSGGANTEQDAPPEDADPQYFYMDPDLGSLAAQLPGVWQRVDTLVGMMHSTRNKRRAIAIFRYQSDTNLRQLAEAVHTLRINLGKYAQIIVREKNASLRYQNEALLLRLGVNLVVHRDVQAARMPLMLGSVLGQIFNRNVDINFEAAMSSVAASALRGYQTPTRFAREVESLQTRATTLNIPYVLIVGHPRADVMMVDLLNRIKLSRLGDLITADNDNCFLFFNACQQSVVIPTLERLLGGSVDSVFDDIHFEVSHEKIEFDIAALLHNAEVGHVTDYTALVTTTVDAAQTEITATVDGVEAESKTALQAPPLNLQLSNAPNTRAQQPLAHLFGEKSPSSKNPSLPDKPHLYAQAGNTANAFRKQEAPRAKRSIVKVTLADAG